MHSFLRRSQTYRQPGPSVRGRADRGYSLIELLAVLAIMGILAMVGIATLGNRQAASVRPLMDELEGILTNARKVATATGRDVAIDTWTTDTASPLVIACGDATMADIDLVKAAHNQLIGAAVPGAAFSAGVIVLYHQLAADTNQSRARIVQPATTDWALAASGAGCQDINSVAPFNGLTVPSFAGLVDDANNLFNPTTTRLVVSGTSHRFMVGNASQTFIIQVVGTSPSAGPLPGSPMGLLLIQQNGSEIYKFYNPGTREGNGKWRRI